MLSAGLPLAAASPVRQLTTDAAIDIWRIQLDQASLRREIDCARSAPSRRRTSSAICLTWSSRGEEVIITRHGKAVARLVPARPTRSREQAHAALRRIRERAEQRKFGPFDWAGWKSYRDQGRP